VPVQRAATWPVQRMEKLSTPRPAIFAGASFEKKISKEECKKMNNKKLKKLKKVKMK
jgi:hypothetical protein